MPSESASADAARKSSVNFGASADGLVAAHEIQQLAYRYALAMDSRNAELLSALWVQGSQKAQFPDMDIDTVHNSIIPSWTSAGPTVMLVGNHIIEFENADTATGSVYCLVRIVLGGKLVEQSVLYRDHYQRNEDAGWLFRCRRHQLFFGRLLGDDPWAQSPAEWPRHQVGRGDLPDGFPGYPKGTLDRPATVHVDFLARHHSGVVAGEEQDGVGDVLC